MTVIDPVFTNIVGFTVYFRHSRHNSVKVIFMHDVFVFLFANVMYVKGDVVGECVDYL